MWDGRMIYWKCHKKDLLVVTGRNLYHFEQKKQGFILRQDFRQWAAPIPSGTNSAIFSLPQFDDYIPNAPFLIERLLRPYTRNPIFLKPYLRPYCELVTESESLC